MALSSAPSDSRPAIRPSLLRSKDLDFLILAGCSCLITLLHHPMVNHLQTGNSTSGNNTVRGPAPVTSPSSTSSASPGSSPTPQVSLGYYNAVNPKRQTFSIEDDEV